MQRKVFIVGVPDAEQSDKDLEHRRTGGPRRPTYPNRSQLICPLSARP
jgi:hypothetical protein